ncbi:nuclease-related domain-containing protein [Alkalihalobacterium alkalinitrilicum]|uniref:nuclease-related domain-containing protein n=1 Tax=Alkalihalobacterium alkalinitrilicum TaxID=427920 RepID=UPI000994EF39|nr:nuclease-related domain-containing protein [Alkalihalobacterium alkalinitrilicum]
MIIKPRNVPLELQILRLLNNRMSLSANSESHYTNLEKGFIGEQKFDERVADRLDLLNGNFLILNDLLFEFNNTLFQIDTILLSSDSIYLFEIKNYEGDFYVEGDSWYKLSRTEIKNPLLQLKRSESLFRRLLQDHGFNFSIEAYLIFVNHGFQLYQAPLNLPIIFPAQLNRFMNKINKTSSTLNDLHQKAAKQLISIHLNESPYTRLPEYTFEQLEKGVTCLDCHSFITEFKEKNLICKKCGCRENITTAVLRSIEEFKTLFPNRKITTNTVHEWCKIIKSTKTIRRILSTNFKPMGHGKYSYYVSAQDTQD